MLEGVRSWFAINPLAQVLLILMVADVITGLLCAIQTRTVSSEISGEGTRRKATMLVLMLVGEVLEPQVYDGISEAIAAFFAVSEGLSIVENAHCLGVPIPPVLTRVFSQLKD